MRKAAQKLVTHAKYITSLPRYKQNGVVPLLPVLLVGLVLSAILGVYLIRRQITPALLQKPDTKYLVTLAHFKELKRKTIDLQTHGIVLASASATLDRIPPLIASNQLPLAEQEIASFSAVLDKAFADKQTADKIASEAAKRKAEEEAKRKALLAQASPSPQTPTATTPVVQTPNQIMAPVINNAPAGGYSRITVGTDNGNFTVDVIKADLSSGVRVITDSGNTSDCADNCTALSLADYVNRNGGFAGMNGTYFCPPDYSFCAGKTNSFNFFIFNYIAKTFLNADKRNYSNAGSAFVFRSGSVQFYRNPEGFGLDTSITGAIACFPTLLADGSIVLNDAIMDDKQRTVKGTRSAIGNKGNTVYLVIGRSATVPDMAAIMKALGVDNAINLDGGGSVAMYYGGYKVGPGRLLPNAIILAR